MSQMEQKSTKKAPVSFAVDAESHEVIYLSGMRLHLLTAAIYLSMFLVNFEVSIVSTSLVTITNDLHGFGRSSWVVTAYLLTYTAFMVIMAKLSDNVGRKSILISSLAGFTVFSGACGAAQTMNQLIVFRAFQGLGASVVYSLVCIIIFEMVPPAKYPRHIMALAGLSALSPFAGPLLGGLISKGSTWRWVFLLNVPAGAVILVMLFLCMPNKFPYHGRPVEKRAHRLRRLDGIGALLMLVALTMLITAFELASNSSHWISAEVLAPILLSVPLLLIFLIYERHITLNPNDAPEPVFPWRFCKNRAILSMFLNSTLVGAVFTTCIIEIPLRFQAAHNETPWRAGTHLIPFGIAVPFGVGVVATVCSKRRLSPIYVQFFSSVLKILGLVFMSRVSFDQLMWKGQYGLQFITGLGCGLTMGVTQILPPFVAEKRDLATSTSAVSQFRMLGGSVTLAILTAIMNNSLKSELLSILSIEEVASIFRTAEAIEGLQEQLQGPVREAFLNGYNLQLRILAGIAAAEIPATLLLWQKENVKIA